MNVPNLLAFALIFVLVWLALFAEPEDKQRVRTLGGNVGAAIQRAAGGDPTIAQPGAELPPTPVPAAPAAGRSIPDPNDPSAQLPLIVPAEPVPPLVTPRLVVRFVGYAQRPNGIVVVGSVRNYTAERLEVSLGMLTFEDNSGVVYQSNSNAPAILESGAEQGFYIELPVVSVPALRLIVTFPPDPAASTQLPPSQ